MVETLQNYGSVYRHLATLTVILLSFSSTSHADQRIVPWSFMHAHVHIILSEQYIIILSLYIHAVPDLPVCVDQRGGPQCCSTQFILDQLNITEQNFLEGLRIELQERFQTFDAIVDRLRACK